MASATNTLGTSTEKTPESSSSSAKLGTPGGSRGALDNAASEAAETALKLNSLRKRIVEGLPDSLKDKNFKNLTRSEYETSRDQINAKYPGLGLGALRFLRYIDSLNLNGKSPTAIVYRDVALTEGELVARRLSGNTSEEGLPADLVEKCKLKSLSYDRWKSSDTASAANAAQAAVAAASLVAVTEPGKKEGNAPSTGTTVSAEKVVDGKAVVASLDNSINRFLGNDAARADENAIVAKNHGRSAALANEAGAQTTMKGDVAAALSSIEQMKLQAKADNNPDVAKRLVAFTAQLQEKMQVVLDAGNGYVTTNNTCAENLKQGYVKYTQDRALLQGKRLAYEEMLKNSKNTEESKYPLDAISKCDQDILSCDTMFNKFQADFDQNKNAELDKSLGKLYAARADLCRFLDPKRDAAGKPVSSGAIDALNADIDVAAATDPVLNFINKTGKVPDESQQAFLKAHSTREYEKQKDRTIQLIKSSFAGQIQDETVRNALIGALNSGKAVYVNDRPNEAQDKFLSRIKDKSERAETASALASGNGIFISTKDRNTKDLAQLINIFNGEKVIYAVERGTDISHKLTFSSKLEYLQVSYLARLTVDKNAASDTLKTNGKRRDIFGAHSHCGPAELENAINTAESKGSIGRCLDAWNGDYKVARGAQGGTLFGKLVDVAGPYFAGKWIGEAFSTTTTTSTSNGNNNEGSEY